jgi:Tfp pilus assembly protein PilN
MTLFQTHVGIDITESGLRLAAVQSRLGGHHVSKFEEISDFSKLSEAGKRTAIASLAQKYNLHRSLVFLTIPRQWGVLRQIGLPVEAADRIPSAVALQIESLSPWTVDEVYWDCAAEKPVKGAKTLKVSVCIVARTVLDPFLDWFRQAGVTLAGASLSSIEKLDGTAAAAGGSGLGTLPAAQAGAVAAALRNGLNLIPAPERFRRNHLRYAPTYALGAALAVVAVLLFLREPYQWSVYGGELDSEIAALKPAVDAVAAQEDKLKRATSAYEVLKARVDARDTNLEALRELARILPPDSWISGYSAQGRTLTISGFAPSASAVQKVLEESAVFEDVQFASPVTRDGSGKDRFSIKATASLMGSAR